MLQRAIDVRVNPSDETIRLGPLAVRFLIAAENSNDSVAAFELMVPGAARLPGPAHSHDHYEETIYGIDGVLTWTVDGKPIEVGPGQALCIPRGAVHRFDNHGTQEAKALCVITPAAIGPQFFREFRRGDQRGGRRSAGPGKDGGNHAPPWPHSGSATASGIAFWRVRVGLVAITLRWAGALPNVSNGSSTASPTTWPARQQQRLEGAGQ